MEIKDHWRLGCQCKVKSDMNIRVPESVLGVKEYECTVISNKNVATFIKEFKVQLPKGAHMDFLPGSYAQIKIPTFSIDYDKDIDKSLIGDEYLPAWQKFGLFPLKCVNTEPTIRAYSMANYPAEGDVFMLTVRIATPPFKPDRSGFMEVNPGIASSYIFTLKPGDKVVMSGPYGDFHPHFDTKKEMIWVGGGAGMAPLRAQIMHMTKTLHTTDREMHYFYGARALNEVFYLDDFLQQRSKSFQNHSPGIFDIGAVSDSDLEADTFVGIAPGEILESLGEQCAVRECDEAAVHTQNLGRLIVYAVDRAAYAVTLDCVTDTQTAGHQLYTVEEIVQDVLQCESKTGGKTGYNHRNLVRRDVQKRNYHYHIGTPDKDSDDVVRKSHVQLILPDESGSGHPDGLVHHIDLVE